MCLNVRLSRRSVGRLIWRPAMISRNGRKLHFHAHIEQEMSICAAVTFFAKPHVSALFEVSLWTLISVCWLVGWLVCQKFSQKIIHIANSIIFLPSLALSLPPSLPSPSILSNIYHNIGVYLKRNQIWLELPPRCWDIINVQLETDDDINTLYAGHLFVLFYSSHRLW